MVGDPANQEAADDEERHLRGKVNVGWEGLGSGFHLHDITGWGTSLWTWVAIARIALTWVSSLYRAGQKSGP